MNDARLGTRKTIALKMKKSGAECAGEKKKKKKQRKKEQIPSKDA
jgi:hypothetical protein